MELRTPQRCARNIRTTPETVTGRKNKYSFTIISLYCDDCFPTVYDLIAPCLIHLQDCCIRRKIFRLGNLPIGQLPLISDMDLSCISHLIQISLTYILVTVFCHLPIVQIYRPLLCLTVFSSAKAAKGSQQK